MVNESQQIEETAAVLPIGPEAILISDTQSRFPVDARKLHAWLQVPRDFPTWMKARLKCGFVSGEDYSPVVGKTQNGIGRPTIEYFLSLRMGEHLALMERGERGRMVRDYFIKCEEKLREISVSTDKLRVADEYQAGAILLKAYIEAANILGSPQSLSKAMAVQAVARHLPVVDFKPLLAQNVSDIQEPLLNPTELGERCGLSARSVNQLLATRGMQVKHGDRWDLTDEGRSFGVYLDTGKKHSNGTPIQQIKWKASLLTQLNLTAA